MSAKVFPCKDCKREFETAKAFSDHFERVKDLEAVRTGENREGSGVIIGCKARGV